MCLCFVCCLTLNSILTLNPAACYTLTFLRSEPTDQVVAGREHQRSLGLRSLETVGLLVESLDDVEAVQPILTSLGRRHICPSRLEDELKVSGEIAQDSEMHRNSVRRANSVQLTVLPDRCRSDAWRLLCTVDGFAVRKQAHEHDL